MTGERAVSRPRCGPLRDDCTPGLHAEHSRSAHRAPSPSPGRSPAFLNHGLYNGTFLIPPSPTSLQPSASGSGENSPDLEENSTHTGASTWSHYKDERSVTTTGGGPPGDKSCTSPHMISSGCGFRLSRRDLGEVQERTFG